MNLYPFKDTDLNTLVGKTIAAVDENGGFPSITFTDGMEIRFSGDYDGGAYAETVKP